MISSDTELLTPVRIGPYLLRNRLVMPPLSRYRADSRDFATPEMVVYYAQRASTGLIVTEGCPVSRQGVGFAKTPGIYSFEHAEAWRPVTSGVHARGGVIFQQLWHVGRQSHSSLQPGKQLPVAPSAIAVEGMATTRKGPQPYEVPRALELDEIPGIIEDFAFAARMSILAGFDGVELHAANGYLFDQFLNDGCNVRTDAYGGSIQHRMRLLLEVVEAVSAICGPDRVGVRLSPSSAWMDCTDSNQQATYSAMVRALNAYGLAYLHLVEPRIAGADTVEMPEKAVPSSHYRGLFSGPVIVTGGHTAKSGSRLVRDGEADLVGFGRTILSNPDFAERIAADAPLNPYHRDTFYFGGTKGYTDYPSLGDERRWLDVHEAIEAGRLNGEGLLADLGRRHPLHLVDTGDHWVALCLAADAERDGHRTDQRGGIRSAPSSLMTSPLR